MLSAACGALAAACALPGVEAPLATRDQQHATGVRMPSSAERAQALSLRALALHRHADGSSSEAQDVRFYNQRFKARYPYMEVFYIC